MAANLPPTELCATGIGALPHTDPELACQAVLEAFPLIPYAPTLPNRGLLERIVFNDSEYLPGAVIEGDRLNVDTGTDLSPAMEQIFLDYLEDNYQSYAAGTRYNSGFHQMMTHDLSGAALVKCQITGPVTLGMQVVDNQKRPILYDTEFADVLSKMIALRARWYEVSMREMADARETLVVLNEPYLAAMGSSVVPLDPPTIRAGIMDVADMLEGGLGIHCCANTDWVFLLSLPIGMVSIDAYQFSREFLLFEEDIAAFMESGGVVGWGIVPAEPQAFAEESVNSLHSRFMDIKTQLCQVVDEDVFNRQSLITPTCGIRFADEGGAAAIMQMTAALSRQARGEVY